jgi:O-antigen/teichoic acid export membrane protein
MIARLYAAGEIERLQRVVTTAARAVLLVSLPIAAPLILFGDWLLSFFGPNFTTGRTALAILTAGQLFNVAIGSVGQLLVMTGHEGDAARGIGIGALLNIVLCAALIPRWGMEGAATATATSTIAWNLLMAVWVYKRLRIRSCAWATTTLRGKSAPAGQSVAGIV